MTIVREGEDTRLPAAARFALMAVADQIDTLADQIFKLERAIVTEAKRDEDMRRLTTIPGVGAITAATIKALVPDPLANKMARIIWALLNKGGIYHRPEPLSIAAVAR